MIDKVDDRHIQRILPLISPAALSVEWPATNEIRERVAQYRSEIEAILDGNDNRLIVIVGPCSVHDPAAAVDYAKQLKARAGHLGDKLLLVMRVYFEKPRTVMGWKGLINDPGLDESYDINHGLALARKLLLDIAEIGLPAGTEFLDTTFGQFYADLISWGAIGARTAESQIHRELASGLSMPVGIKNRTDGDVQVAVDAIRAAAHRHLFPTLTKEGTPAIYETSGNEYAHLILRGGDRSGSNYDAASIGETLKLLAAHDLPWRLIVDCSHGNSGKNPNKQIEVVESICQQRKQGTTAIKGVMLESHLKSGRQNYSKEAEYGKSITD
ncbi:MAG: 3-deoxy-7-phosphoheptulonate synthase, partial [Pseudomonadales bacterium]